MNLDVDAIACPRCHQPLDPFIKRGARDEVPAHMCLACGGLWLDGATVRHVYPGLASLSRSMPAHAPDATRPVLACPRCAEMPVTFTFFEVELDACPTCKGVWVDGDELADLARSADRAEGLPAPDAGSYRDNAREALGGGVACRGCGARVDLELAELTSRGPMCADCAGRIRDELLDAQLADYEPPKNSILSAIASLPGPGLRDVAAVFGAVLEAGTRCTVCGCHHASRCEHHG
ncbi:MAG TPA: zf-TFIIB domain-containing protein [Polyangiaceae bacterium]|jgi:Zn-finger nucleic acid-binding protein|nr:zf-TFIIB domain-containing protein [Polyangiaceae bacterium]